MAMRSSEDAIPPPLHGENHRRQLRNVYAHPASVGRKITPREFARSCDGSPIFMRRNARETARQPHQQRGFPETRERRRPEWPSENRGRTAWSLFPGWNRGKPCQRLRGRRFGHPATCLCGRHLAPQDSQSQVRAGKTPAGVRGVASQRQSTGIILAGSGYRIASGNLDTRRESVHTRGGRRSMRRRPMEGAHMRRAAA